MPVEPVTPPADTSPIPVLRPQLPTAERLLPYLKKIDENRIYSNFGPLNAELERRLVQALGHDGPSVVTAANGTMGLIAAILACAGPAVPEKPLAVIPSYSFVATAVAAERCGYRVHLADIDEASWCLDPAALLDNPVLAEAGFVMPVAPFGRALDEAAWLAFREKTGIPVIFDVAAGFSVLEGGTTAPVGAIPHVFSFHATKGFGIGEGGAVVSTDILLLNEIRRRLNFGFLGSRDSETPSINGKLSEYHAAIGLAALDDWPDRWRALKTVAAAYAREFAAIGRGASFFGAPEIDGGYALFLCASDEESRNVQRSLEKAVIGFRFWYGDGIHRHSHFAGARRDTMTATDRLGARLIGLPMAPDLSQREIERVAAIVAAALRLGSD